jgi:hypothetical protein
MTLTLRQRHRRLIWSLAIILPVAVAVGLSARRSVPVAETLPIGLAPQAGHLVPTAWAPDNLFSKTHVRGQLLQDSADVNRLAIRFSSPESFVKPDLIVYWTDGDKTVSESLPNDAQFLGAFTTEIELPNKVVRSNGRLILYSLADGEVADVSVPIQIFQLVAKKN